MLQLSALNGLFAFIGLKKRKVETKINQLAFLQQKANICCISSCSCVYVCNARQQRRMPHLRQFKLIKKMLTTKKIIHKILSGL